MAELLTKAQIAARIAEAEKLGAEYEARGEIGRAQEFWLQANEWRERLSDPGREAGTPAASEGPGLFSRLGKSITDAAKRAAAAPGDLLAQPQHESASYMHPGIKAASVPLAAAAHKPGGVPGVDRPFGVVVLDAGGRAAKWIGAGLLGAGLGAVALRVIRGGRR